MKSSTISAMHLNELRALIALGVARDKLEEMFGYTGLLALERQLAEGDKGDVVDAEFTEIVETPKARTTSEEHRQ